MPTGQLPRRRTRVSKKRVPPPPPRPETTTLDAQAWVEKVKALPDLRWEKVRAVRDALAEGGYDVEARLDDLIDRLPEALQTLASRR